MPLKKVYPCTHAGTHLKAQHGSPIVRHLVDPAAVPVAKLQGKVGTVREVGRVGVRRREKMVGHYHEPITVAIAIAIAIAIIAT